MMMNSNLKMATNNCAIHFHPFSDHHWVKYPSDNSFSQQDHREDMIENGIENDRRTETFEKKGWKTQKYFLSL
jgi:hypothetical protein